MTFMKADSSSVNFQLEYHLDGRGHVPSYARVTGPLWSKNVSIDLKGLKSFYWEDCFYHWPKYAEIHPATQQKESCTVKYDLRVAHRDRWFLVIDVGFIRT